MTFLHGSLVALGSLMMAVPIILHLTMRQRPKHALFPALRFVTATLIQNQRKLQLRQWALLALRCFAVAAAALALARPLLPVGAAGSTWLLGSSVFIWAMLAAIGLLVWRRGSSRWLAVGFTALVVVSTVGFLAIVASVFWSGSEWMPHDQETPVAAVFVMDDSPRMEYRDRNDTRLQVAQSAALALLRQLPPGSDIAILAVSAESTSFTVDSTSAAAAVRGMQTSLITRFVPDAIATAQAMLRGQKRNRREIFVLSDLTRIGWPSSDASPAAPADGGSRETGDDTSAAQEESPAAVATYIVDVGVRDASNIRLGLPRLPDASSAADEIPIDIDINAFGVGDSSELEVELWLEEPATERPVVIDGQPQRPRESLKDRQRFEVSDTELNRMQFQLSGIEEGIRHGRLRVSSSDALTIDNERYFTIAVAPAERILLASGPQAAPQFLAEALAPYELRQSGRARFECEVISTADLNDYSLVTFSAIFLVDPPPLEPAIWQKIGSYVERGGGLAILLGRNAQPVDEFNSTAAMSLLPGKLSRQWRAGDRPLFLTMTSTPHPMLTPFRPWATSIPWDQSPIYRHWVLQDVSPSAVRVMEFRNRQPAVLESRRGLGTILTGTTSLSDELNLAGRPAWNLLPTGPTPWPFVMLVDRMATYLVGRDRARWNFTVGESPSLPAADTSDGTRVQTFTPQGTWETLLSRNGTISFSRLSEIGVYRIALADGEIPSTGFAVNLPAEATDLQRLTDQELDAILGEGQYRLLGSQGDLTREISASRIGQEGYPWTVLALALLLAAEHVLGNRFYASH